MDELIREHVDRLTDEVFRDWVSTKISGKDELRIYIEYCLRELVNTVVGSRAYIVFEEDPVQYGQSHARLVCFSESSANEQCRTRQSKATTENAYGQTIPREDCFWVGDAPFLTERVTTDEET